MEPYLPIPFRAGNKIVRQYTERQVDSNFNSSLVTLVDWKDNKGKLHEGHTLFVKWVDPIVPDWSRNLSTICGEIYKDACTDKNASVEQINKIMAEGLMREFGFKLPDKQFYVTVGIYPNLYFNNRLEPQGMWKWNYVHRDHIYTHLIYNMMFRPGRTFFIDNVCYNNGMHSDKSFLAAKWYCEKVTADILSKPPRRETTPYE